MERWKEIMEGEGRGIIPRDCLKDYWWWLAVGISDSQAGLGSGGWGSGGSGGRVKIAFCGAVHTNGRLVAIGGGAAARHWQACSQRAHQESGNAACAGSLDAAGAAAEAVGMHLSTLPARSA